MALLSATGLAGAVLRPATAAASAPAHLVNSDVFQPVEVERTAPAVVVVAVPVPSCNVDGLTVLSPEDCG